MFSMPRGLGTSSLASRMLDAALPSVERLLAAAVARDVFAAPRNVPCRDWGGGVIGGGYFEVTPTGPPSMAARRHTERRTARTDSLA